MTFTEQTIDGFLSGVASSQVAPSAGATAALTGALAASLCEMVCIHTSEAKRSERLAGTEAELRERRGQLLALADEDAAAINEVQAVFETDTDEDQEQVALRTATEIPVRIAERARDVVTCATVVAADGNPNAQADALVGATIARAVVASAAAIVRANVGLLEDDAFVTDVQRRVESAEADANAAAARITGQDE